MPSLQQAGPSGALPSFSPISARPADSLVQCLAWIGRHHGDDRSPASWSQGLPRPGQDDRVRHVIRAAQTAGFVATLSEQAPRSLSPYVLPAILLLKDGRGAVLLRHADAEHIEVAMPEGGDELVPVRMRWSDLDGRLGAHCLLIKPRPRADHRAGAPLQAAAGHWFWSALWTFRQHYGNVALAAVMINVLTLAGTFFTMNVYDRVVPAHAYPTLWTLAIGTALAMVFEFAARQMRSHLVDDAGKKVDLVLGARLFAQAMNVRLERRASSSGSFAYRLKEFESLRDFTTSATVSALTDLPFALLFVAVIVAIGGPLAWVMAVVVPLVLGLGWLIQWPLARHMQEQLREGALKHGLLVETLEGMETLKALHAEGRMQKLWNDYSALSAASSLKSRNLTNLALNVVSLIQQLTTVVLVVWGVYLIHEGQLSLGALIAVVLLSRQAIAPMAQVVGLAIRFQQAKASMKSLNALMAEPVDREADRRYLSRTRFVGALQLRDLGFSYPEQTLPSLDGISLKVAAGEHVALLGRIGSGKSTLMRLVAGLYQPSVGAMLVDDIDLRQIDPSDVRRNISLVTQDCRLFHGTLRDNLEMAQPHATVERLLEVCRLVGLDSLIQRHPQGLDQMIGEGGSGLSGGQRQLVALARAVLADTPIVLMDEPTSAMDAQTEAAFMQRIRSVLRHRTLIIATHRMALLDLVERVVVLDQGRVVADGGRDALLKMLKGAGVPAAAPSGGKS